MVSPSCPRLALNFCGTRQIRAVTNRLSVVRQRNFVSGTSRSFETKNTTFFPLDKITNMHFSHYFSACALSTHLGEVAHRNRRLKIPSRSGAMVGEKLHKNRRPSTLHSPSEKMKITCCKVPGATPDASGLIPLSHAVHGAKVRVQNSICSTCCARLEFQKNTTGRRADFCSE